MDAQKVLKLSDLARIRISPEEADHLSQEFDSILKYVGEVKGAAPSNEGKKPEDFPVRNVMREDSAGHESGIYSEALLAAAPAQGGNYIKVKKIL